MHLLKKGDTYHVSIRTATGKSKTLTTGQTNKADADRVTKDAHIKELELAARAGKLTSQAIGLITTGRKISMRQAIPQFADWASSINRSERTVYCEVSVLNKWIKEQRIEHLAPASIDESHINPFINDPKAGTRATSRNSSLSAIRSFFAFAVAKGWSPRDPSKLVRVNLHLIPHQLKETTERQAFTKSELATILKAEYDRIETIAQRRARIEFGKLLSVPQRRLLLTKTPEAVAKAAEPSLLAQWTDLLEQERERARAEEIFWPFAITISEELGLRLGDICQLEWDCFRKPGHIILWTDKRDRRIKVPISDSLQQLITQVPLNHDRYLFPRERDLINNQKLRATLSKTFTRRCAKLGIHKSFHCIRHYRATQWNKEGKSLESIGKDLGHAHTSTTKGYLHE